jgi:hypothetical protein
MSPDRAAELLQIPERGLDLLQRFNEDETIRKALQAVESGFDPADVAEMYKLPYDQGMQTSETVLEDASVHVYECQTNRCRQKGRVATSSVTPDEADEDISAAALITCQSCGKRMVFVKSVEDEWELGQLKRASLPRTRVHDSMHGVDRGSASDRGIDEGD